jgi:hypothetical protein
VIACANASCEVAQAVREDVREAHHDGRRQVARLQALHDLVQVDLATGLLVRAHHDVALLVDREVALAPGLDVIQIARIVDVPGRCAIATAGGAVGTTVAGGGNGRRCR